MNQINETYNVLCNTPSDINEHLPTLNKLSQECNTIAEFGVRSMVSTWAFLNGLYHNSSDNKNLISVDINDVPGVNTVIKLANEYGINMKFIKNDSVKCEIPEVDLLFIDTWHIYGHLKRELNAHHKKVKKYIVMHDTELDKVFGETVRCNWNAVEQSRDSGYPITEILCGLEKAITEFLIDNPEWYIYKVYYNNNGLTVLKKKD